MAVRAARRAPSFEAFIMLSFLCFKTTEKWMLYAMCPGKRSLTVADFFKYEVLKERRLKALKSLNL